MCKDCTCDDYGNSVPAHHQPHAQKGVSVSSLVKRQTSSISRRPGCLTITMTIRCSGRGELRSASEGHTSLCATLLGTTLVPLWCAGSWGFPLMVPWQHAMPSPSQC